MNLTLQPGEFFDPVSLSIWSRIAPHVTIQCDDLSGCQSRAEFELERTLHGTCAPSFKCQWHAPSFTMGTGQQVTVPPATGGPIGPNRYTENWVPEGNKSCICEHAACNKAADWKLDQFSFSSFGPSHLCHYHMQLRVNSNPTPFAIAPPPVGSPAFMVALRLVWSGPFPMHSTTSIDASFGSTSARVAGGILFPNNAGFFTPGAKVSIARTNPDGSLGPFKEFGTVAKPPLGKVKVLDSGCPDCWGTGFYHGYGVNCQRGCKP